ncbi:hypothetical protein CCR75_003193 [Bremia lactucae]|uniref:Apple domain-containing protein n=1 Tax=Bremia lactucae TaxID=4779 RepID=A0A976IEY1_BRELC|nr:hypothetical protein CCR75_003193 [Bremia lactucae]
MQHATLLFFSACAVAAVSQAEGTCSSLEYNVDYSGNDRGNAPSSSVKDCCTICSSTFGCNAFTWTDYHGGTCWLKQSKTTSKPSDGAISGTVEPSPQSSNCPSLERNIDYSGTDIGNAPSASADGCCFICSNTNNCKAFTWTSYNSGTCWLKNTVGSLKEVIGAISGRVSGSNANEWRMSPIKVIHARVQGDEPVWHPGVNLWLSKFGYTAEDRYMNNLDTVNTASVEGALMYVQAEGINMNEQSVRCQRKNRMQYIVFYEITIVQPTKSIKYYRNHNPFEYGPFTAMDGGKCTNSGSDIKTSCKAYYGLDGVENIGTNVGCDSKSSDPRAPYPGNYWYSFPNSCAHHLRADKTSACRGQFSGGLCPLGDQPNGLTCTYSYTILGYLNIDDLVGITKMGFYNYHDFCQSGGVEFKARNTGNGFQVEQSLEFWRNPGDPNANSNRAVQMVAMYNQMIRSGQRTNMTLLPTVETLAAANPECYKNSGICARAKFGCKRQMLSQLCTVCSSEGSDCVVAPPNYLFPDF